MAYNVDESYRLRKMAQLASFAESVLDVGCAQYPNVFLKNKTVVGVDLEDGIMPCNYTNFIRGDLRTVVESNRAYQAVVAGEVLEHVKDPIGFLRQCNHVLEPGGSLILSTPNPHCPIESLLTITLSRKFYYTADHVMLFPQRWLIRMLELADFVDVQLYSGGFPIPGIGLLPCPRYLCYQTIAVAKK